MQASDLNKIESPSCTIKNKEVPVRIATPSMYGYIDLVESPDDLSIETSITITHKPVTKQDKEE